MKNLDIIINKYDIIFWDFDGVIKDSNNVKLKCFLDLFKSQNLEIKKKIKQHHINNIGISRNKKIPIYLSWINKKNNKNIKKYLLMYEKEVIKKVIKSKWIPGVLKIIKNSNQKQVIVTSAPNIEIKKIIKKINLEHYFDYIFGYPSIKAEVIKKVIKQYNLKKKKCIMIGDSLSDFKAAKKNKISFILVKNKFNHEDFLKIKVKKINNFL